MDILWNPKRIFNGIDLDIALGLLLGYTKSNIIYFIEKNYKVKIDKKKIKHVFTIIQNEINKMNTTLEDLNKFSKIVVLEKIHVLV